MKRKKWMLQGGKTMKKQIAAMLAALLCAAVSVDTIPAVWVLLTTLYAAMQKVVHTDVKISFLAHAEKFKAAFDAGEVLAPAKDLAQMQQIIFNDWVNASLTIIFSAVVIMMLGVMVSIAIKMSKKTLPESFETKPVFAD